MKVTLTFFCFILFSQAFGQVKKIKISEFSNKEYYDDLTFLSEGEKYSKSEDEREIAFRVIIMTSEIYNSLILEMVSYGSEGGNKQILNKSKVDLDQLWYEFKLKGEIASIEFVKWLTWNSFELKILDSVYVFEDISDGTITVFKK